MCVDNRNRSARCVDGFLNPVQKLNWHNCVSGIHCGIGAIDVPYATTLNDELFVDRSEQRHVVECRRNCMS